MKKITNLALCFFIPTLATAQVVAPSTAASVALSTNGISQIVQGSGNILAAGSQLTIVSINNVGEFIDITLQAVANSATVTLRVSRNILGNSLLATGQAVQVIGVSSGNLIYVAGQLIAFLPNELGRHLLFSQKL
ncbi:Uncharacterised protein [Legionella beliardensis]|uniref:DUF5666 domain-containing protein n=1 Tax=Legionella beliardensis TaxID=91822 RepID=A0A378HYF3_9GAMM|nr:hypothetical protein [Legionella beliardensis]STX27927.1 Uncharacterised protein [Legionella beliardensis]